MTCTHTVFSRIPEDLCVNCLEERIAALTEERDALAQAKDGAYSERNQCVALMAQMARQLRWNVWVGQHPAEDTAWESDWRTILFIRLPTGQASWHFHDSEVHLLEGLPRIPPNDPHGRWDGHDTPEKYRRVRAALSGAPKESEGA